MQDYIIWAIIIAILGSAISYIIIQKRKGVKCIGCPSEASCGCDKSAKSSCCTTIADSPCCDKSIIKSST